MLTLGRLKQKWRKPGTRFEKNIYSHEYRRVLRENSHARLFYWNKKIRTKKGEKGKKIKYEKVLLLRKYGGEGT